MDQAAGAGHVKLTLTFAKDETGGGGEGGTHQHPTRIDTTGGSISFDYQLTTPVATLAVGPGALDAPAIFQIEQVAVVPGSPPPGMELASGMFRVRNFEPSSGAWVASPGAFSIDAGSRTVTISTLASGVYAVFAPRAVPAVSRGHLVVGAAALVLAAWLLFGPRRSRSSAR